MDPSPEQRPTFRSRLREASAGGFYRSMQRSLRARVTLLIIAVTIPMGVITCGVFLIMDIRAYETQARADLKTISAELNDRVAAAMTLDRPSDPDSALRPLRAQSSIIMGALYRADGTRFSAYSKGGDDWAPRQPPGWSGYRTRNRVLELSAPVIFRGAEVGQMLLRSGLDPMYERIVYLSQVSGGILAVSLLLALILGATLQQPVTGPLRELAETAHHVMREHDYTVRAQRRTRDEIGLLVESFNSMLAHIQERDNALRATLSMLEEASQETLYRLARAAEFRDEDTGFHVHRVSQYAAILADAHGMSKEDVELIRNATPLHDVGKIGVSDTLLFKPGKLTDEEFDLIKEHTTIGARILHGSSSEVLAVAEQIAISHHEKWDGSGYPEGLSGEDIPLSGRICAVADVYDALRSDRPYKKAFTVEKALEIITDGAGKHFDPALVDLFVENLSRIQEMEARYSDFPGKRPSDAEFLKELA